MVISQQLFEEFKKNLEKEVAYLKQEIILIRTGKASPALIENILVETYAGAAKLKLKELATITAEDSLTLLIVPFDPSTISDIEKAILKSSLHLTPKVEGKNIYIKFPLLSEEQRKNLLKLVSQKAELSRERIRIQRDEARKKIKNFFENKQISEDEKFRMEKEIDKITQEFNNQISEIKEKKEKEIMGR